MSKLFLCCLQYLTNRQGNESTTRMGFEPTRAEHNGLAVHHLNHSVTSSDKRMESLKAFNWLIIHLIQIETAKRMSKLFLSYLQYLTNRQGNDSTTRMGFEPTRAEHNGLAVHHLNHSVTSSDKRIASLKAFN